jgi:hypothetical protein
VTTVAYDKIYIASDSAYTVNETTYTDIPFSKIQKINNVIFGMAGMLSIMLDFTKEMFYNENFDVKQFLLTEKGDFGAILYKNQFCLKIDKEDSFIKIQDITNVPTVIGSGSLYTEEIINNCPDAVISVLKAIEKDQYSKGEIKYCGLKCEINNLNKETKTELEEMQKYFFHERGQLFAHKNFYHDGNPVDLELEEGFEAAQKIIDGSEISSKNIIYSRYNYGK